MGSSSRTSEITTEDEMNLVPHFKGLTPINCKLRVDVRCGKAYGHREGRELDRLPEEIDMRASPRTVGSSCRTGADLLQKSALKKPIRVGTPQASGIGISESVTLKQALRRLCISQASEIAAMKRSKPIGLSGISEAGTIKRLYAAVIVQGSESLDEGKGNLLEISLVPERCYPEISGQTTGPSKLCKVEISSKAAVSSPRLAAGAAERVTKAKVKDVIASPLTNSGSKPSAKMEQPTKGKSKTWSPIRSSKAVSESSKPVSSPRLMGQTFKSKNSTQKKVRNDLAPKSGCSTACNELDKFSGAPSKSKLGFQKESPSTMASNANQNTAVASTKMDCNVMKPDSTSVNVNKTRALGGKGNGSSRSKEKGECSQSSKSSMGDYSSSTSISDESSQSTSSGNGCRPHMLSGPCAESSCIDPLCLQPSWVQASCFTPRLLSSTAMKTKK
ncbi:hypothetical protein Taro_029895, partial [Colocasia esculenta]|nr:hypothetical protein [Colocasia esculenta]